MIAGTPASMHNRQIEPFSAAFGASNFDGLFHRLPQIERVRLELDLAGFDLREIQDVVDDRQQAVAGPPDRLGEVALFRR